MNFTMPAPIQFTEGTRAFGASYWLDGELEKRISGDLKSVEVVVRLTNRRRRQLGLSQLRAANSTIDDDEDDDEDNPELSPAGRRFL